MQITFDNFKSIKYLFSFIAVLIVAFSVYVSNRLAKDMAEEERERIELWAEATRLLVSDVNGSDLNFILKVIEKNHTIPVLISDEENEVITFRNFEIPSKKDTTNFLSQKLQELKGVHDPILMQIDEDTLQYLYYDDSLLLKKLAYYPYLQAGIIIVFFCGLFFFFASAKKSEQNRVWVGLSKETAHQLGTPISSLLAWMELGKETGIPADYIPEMQKDVDRLQIVAERFSKIGSIPELTPTQVAPVIESTVNYMRKRASKRITFQTNNHTEEDISINMNKPLFEWVLENLCKNAVDSITGNGQITIDFGLETSNSIYIEVSDTGKGIAKSKFSTVFNPGYTTKKRGWGLGLSLVKRIIEEYHHGKIYVKHSEIGKGTTFRIELATGV